MAVLVAMAGGGARGADYLVDSNYAGVDGAAYGSYAGAYKTVAAALGSTGVPAGTSAANPNRVYFAPGVYNTANVTGVSLSNSRSNLMLLGTTGNADDVVITSTLDSSYNPGAGTLGTTGSSTLQLKGNNVSAAYITFANSTDTPYIATVSHQAVSPQGNYATGQTQASNSPAVALLLQGDQQAFYGCKFMGYQDTLYTKGGRTYFKNCYVTGDIDFIFASGTSVFNNCQINMDGDHSGGTITAASTDKRTSNGLVFLNSTVTGNSVHGNAVIDSQNVANITGPAANSMSLGRPWGWTQTGGDASTVFINTKMDASVRSAGWLAWDSTETNAANGKNGGDPTKDARYAEYNSMDLSGNPLDVSGRVTWSHQLAASQAGAYSVANLFATEAGYAWYGFGYPAGDLSNPGTGSANPNDPNFSWPAFWGDRNSNNETGNATVSGVYPNPGNPAAYSDPSWTIAGSWDAESAVSSVIAAVPEPTTALLLGVGAMLLVRRRR